MNFRLRRRLRGGNDAAGDGVGQIPVELRRGVGHACLALHLGRKQRMDRAARRPCILVCAQKPDGIGREACRLRRAGNLDGRVAGFGGKERFVQRAGQNRQKILPLDAAAIEAQ